MELAYKSFTDYVWPLVSLKLPYFSTMVSKDSDWNLDVSALMVLVGEKEESRYRSMTRSLTECLSPAPVAGLQSYLHSYEWVQDGGNYTYYSPYGGKSAPLRNPKLAQTIDTCGLLADGQVSIYKVPPSSRSRALRPWTLLKRLWFLLQWAYLGGIMVLLYVGDNATWIGRANCLGFSLWSILLRLIESRLIESAQAHKHVASKTDHDAFYILGRSASAFILEGAREDVKAWSALGLQFARRKKDATAFERFCAWLMHTFSRLGSSMMLLFIFTTIPNGNTTDQIAFALLNVLGQLNVLVGREINAHCQLDNLELVEKIPVENTTSVYAVLLRRFSKDGKDTEWAEKAGLLPQTDIWDKWCEQVVQNLDEDPKQLYNRLAEEMKSEKRPRSNVSAVSS
jgi:hypothetical protein